MIHVQSTLATYVNGSANHPAKTIPYAEISVPTRTYAKTFAVGSPILT